jgi:hypothetical protein
VSGYVVECDLCARALGLFIAVLKLNDRKLESAVLPVLVDLWRAKFDAYNAKVHSGKAKCSSRATATPGTQLGKCRDDSRNVLPCGPHRTVMRCLRISGSRRPLRVGRGVLERIATDASPMGS